MTTKTYIQKANNEPIYLSSASSAFITLHENVYFGAKFNGHGVYNLEIYVSLSDSLKHLCIIRNCSVYCTVYTMPIWPHAELCNVFLSFLTSDQSVLS